MLGALLSLVVILSSLCNGLEFDLSNCGLGEKGCFFAPDCNNDNTCQAYVTYADNGAGGINFEFSRIGEGYIALGLNPTSAQMSGTLVFHCARDPSSNTIRAELSYNQGYTHTYFTEEINSKAGIVQSSVQTEFVNNYLKCSFTWNKDASTVAVGDEGQYIFPVTDSSEFYLLQSYGSVSDGGIMNYHTDRYTSSSKVSLSSGASTVGVETVPILVRLHGALMVISWIMLVSVAIMLARFYKDVWPGRMICTKPVWFTFHRMNMVMAFLLTCTSFTLIFIDKKAWVNLSGEGSIFFRYHHVIGVVVTALAITNPLMALFRPHPGAPRRNIFNWAHWGVGTAAHILGVLNVFSGLNLNASSPAIPYWLTWMLLGFVLFHILIDLVLELNRCCNQRKARSNAMEMTQNGEPGNSPTSQAPQTQTLRKVLFGIYFTVAVIVTLVVVIILFINGSYP